jgi:phosphatidate cytidylyltransferase
MCPTISPGKSWEGLAGSVFGSMLISSAFMPLTSFGFGKSLALGVVAALVGTFGDLVESRFKRECQVKDSATFMPAGLGGFLDMFDSLIFAPAVLYPFLQG